MSIPTDVRYESTTTDLLCAARSGDRSAWEQIVKRYARLVRSIAAEFRLQESDAADVAQNTWLRLLAYGGTIRDPEKLGSWLATTARREACAFLRRSRPEVATESAGDGVAAGGPSPEDVVVAAETAAAVRRAAGELSDRQRLLVDALFYQSPSSATTRCRGERGCRWAASVRPGSGR